MPYWISLKVSSLPHCLMEYVCMCMDLAYVQHILVKPSRKIMVSCYREARNITFQDLTFLDCQNLSVSSLTFPYLFCLYFIKKIQFQKIFCWFYLEEILKMFITLSLIYLSNLRLSSTYFPNLCLIYSNLSLLRSSDNCKGQLSLLIV